MSRHDARSVLFAWVLVGALLTACVGGQTKNPNFYTLLTEADSTEASTIAEIGTRPVLSVGPIRLPEYLRRPQIVTRAERTRLEQAEFERWAGPLESQIEAALARDLATDLQDLAVVSHRQRGIEPAYRVSVNIKGFVGRLDGRLELSATWTLSHEENKEESLSLHSSRIHVDVAGPDYAALVEAHQQALTVLSRQIADAVRRLWHNSSARPADPRRIRS